MIDELRARFRTRFIETARGRVHRALELLGTSDGASGLMIELHSLAGEAALLGLTEISEAARGGEEAAKEWVQGKPSARVSCVRAVRMVSQRVEAFAAEPEDGAGQAPDDSTEAPAGRRVLVIDDSRLSGEQVTDALDEAGMVAELTTDRDGALAAVGRFRPEIVLSDVNMPGIDLAALCDDLRDAAGGPLTVILLSSMSEDNLARRSAEVGADGYITKQRGTSHVVARLQSIMDME